MFRPTAFRLTCLAACLLGSCTKQPSPDATQTAGKSAEPAKPEILEVEDSTPPPNDPHLVVFADRTSQAYLLLLPPEHEGTPTRDDLQTLVKAKLGAKQDEPELALLLEMIATAPKGPDPGAGAGDGSPRATRDLLGTNVEVLPVAGKQGAVAAESLADPILTRELTPQERASLPTRGQALLLRAEYRNQYAVRGLRLLQTLVRIVALERDALIHDPDTGETMGIEAFTRRRLKSSLGNVADQIAVVPFADKNLAGGVRLTTRGMRRFGSVDLELDGLPADPVVLQRATHLLYGLAVQMVQLGEFDISGYAVELDELVTVDIDDVVKAYGARGDQVPRCEGCAGEVEMHLVERPPEPHDPSDHSVVRVVAVRELSDAANYDHATWIAGALRDLLGE